MLGSAVRHSDRKFALAPNIKSRKTQRNLWHAGSPLKWITVTKRPQLPISHLLWCLDQTSVSPFPSPRPLNSGCPPPEQALKHETCPPTSLSREWGDRAKHISCQTPTIMLPGFSNSHAKEKPFLFDSETLHMSEMKAFSLLGKSFWVEPSLSKPSFDN